MAKASGVAGKGRNKTMEMTNWAPEHSDALRDYLAKGMSFSEIANATIGRARRLGLTGPDRPSSSLAAQPQLDRLGGLRASKAKSIACHWPAQPSRTPSRSSCAALRSSRVIFRCSISAGAIAGILTAATKRAKP